MEKSWLLVEWIKKDILCASFDVVNAKCLEGNKQDVCVGKLSILREKYSNNTRPGKVLYISDDKQQLNKMKCMLMRMTEQMKITVEMFNNTISQMKSELMSDCNRIRSKGGKSNNENYDLSSKKRKIKPTVDKDTQTVQRYSPDTINELRTSLKTGYEELTTIVFSLKEDRNRTNENLVINNVESTKKIKRDTEDDISANAGPIKKKIRAWNELQETDTQEEKIKTLKTPNTCTSMRQYINRKVLSPIRPNDLELDNNELNLSNKNNKNISVSAENKENEEITLPENNNIYSFPENPTTNVDSTTYQFKEEMVPIGSGKTLIPKHIYENLNWNSYTNVTRKLLQILFTREVLSTHSLSGKRSPAFSNKPAKKQLNPHTVDDIVATVAQKCDIKESFVRTCITVKCADEAKMLRQRKSRSSIKSEQNDPPVKESSSQVDENSRC